METPPPPHPNPTPTGPPHLYPDCSVLINGLAVVAAAAQMFSIYSTACLSAARLFHALSIPPLFTRVGNACMHTCTHARVVPRQQAPIGNLEAGRSAWHIHLLLPAMGVGAAAAATYGCSTHVIVVVVVFRRIYFSVCGANVHAATAVPCWCFSFHRQAQSWPLPQLRLASGFFAFHPHHPRCAKKRASLCAAHT